MLCIVRFADSCSDELLPHYLAWTSNRKETTVSLILRLICNVM